MNPIIVKTTADLCADHLREQILRGEHPPGTRLPPERELSESLGVNRMTLRAALARLAQEGLLLARQGSGHKVRDFLDSGGLALVPAVLEVMAEHKARLEALNDLLATRRALARVVLVKAAAVLDAMSEQRREEALAPMAEAVAELKRRAAEGMELDALSAADQAVVAALVRLTASPVLPLLMNPVAALLAGLHDLRTTIYAEPDQNVRGWVAVLSWLGASGRAPFEVIEALMVTRDERTLARLGRRAVQRKGHDAK